MPEFGWKEEDVRKQREMCYYDQWGWVLLFPDLNSERVVGTPGAE